MDFFIGFSSKVNSKSVWNNYVWNIYTIWCINYITIKFYLYPFSIFYVTVEQTSIVTNFHFYIFSKIHSSNSFCLGEIAGLNSAIKYRIPRKFSRKWSMESLNTICTLPYMYPATCGIQCKVEKKNTPVFRKAL